MCYRYRSYLIATCAGLGVSLLGCTSQNSVSPVATKSEPSSQVSQQEIVGTANPEAVAAAKKRLAELGPAAKFALAQGLLAEIVIQDGSSLSEEDIALFGRLTDLKKLQIYNCRPFNDEMAKQLLGLKELQSLALVNTVINDASVELIAKSFPKLNELDLSSNTNLTAEALKQICEISKLQKLTLIQTGFNDITTRRLAKLEDLRALDLRGNMEAGDMTLESISGLAKLTSFKHRSTAVSDFGMEHLTKNTMLENLLVQDFAISSQTGEHLAKLRKLKQLEIFRCPGFGSEGVLALKGLDLDRLTLRDLPSVDDQALEVFTELPKLRRLYLHELGSISDSGLSQLAALNSLELLDIWNVPQMTDATIDVISALPNLKELSIRSADISDAAIDKLLAMPKLQTLTFKENANITAEALKKLSTRPWAKLDVGT